MTIGRAALRLALALLALLTASGVAGAAGQAARCAPNLHLIARGAGGPDDVAFAGDSLYFGDVVAGTLSVLHAGRVRTVARDLRVPEGIVPLGPRRLVVVEQATNQLVTVDRVTGRVRDLLQLENRTGTDGVDSIAAAPRGGIYIPDSPNGRLLLLDRRGRLRVLAGGLDRPVGAIRFQGAVAVPDEHANTVWMVRAGRATRTATLSIPDDVAVLGRSLLAVTLGDHALWQVWPRPRRLLTSFVQPQGLAVGPRGQVVVADSTGNAVYRVDGLRGCLG